MTHPKEVKPEEPHPDKYSRFIRLLTDIVSVPKSAIYMLDPSLRPKPRPIKESRPKTGENRP